MSPETGTTVPGDGDRQPGASFRSGEVFAGHRIEGELGRGGMGIVYRARHLSLDRPRALKVIAEHLAGDPAFKARFRREARLAASIDHPAVAAVHHAGEENGIPFLSMTLVEGPDLGRLVAEEGPLEPARAAHLIQQVAAGLEAAHSAGLVHRDVKPSNVVVKTREGEEVALITDFGLARLADDDAGITLTGDFMGSVDFVAPEQIEGTTVDARTDVYSLGALTYFLLTGEPPFARRSSAAKLVAHVNAERPSPSAARAPVSRSVDQAVRRAMAVEPAERFARPGDFAQALAAAVPEPERITGPPKPTLAVAFVIVVVALAAVTALLAAGGRTKDKTDPPAQPAARAVATIDVATGPTGLTTGAGFTWVAAREAGVVQAIPASGQAVVKARDFELGEGGAPISVGVGFDSVWIVDGPGDRLLRAPLDGTAAPSSVALEDPQDVVVTREGVWVAQGEPDTVSRVDPGTGEVTAVLPVADGPQSIAFGDGSVWVACIDAGTVLRIDAEAEEVTGKPIEAGTRPNDLAVGEDGVWVIDNLEGVVRRIDPNDLTAGAPIEVGARPRGVVAAAGSVWIANSEDGTVTEIDEADRRQAGEPIRVGADPADISEGGGSIWTANFDDDTVSRIELR